VPDETARVARALFPDGNLYLQWYDTLGMLFADEDFVTLFARDGQPALSPVRLSLVLILPFFENLGQSACSRFRQHHRLAIRVFRISLRLDTPCPQGYRIKMGEET
jgi:transposase